MNVCVRKARNQRILAQELKNAMQSNYRQAAEIANPGVGTIQGAAALIPACEGIKDVSYMSASDPMGSVEIRTRDGVRGEERARLSIDRAKDDTMVTRHFRQPEDKAASKHRLKVALHSAPTLPNAQHFSTQMARAGLKVDEFMHALRKKLCKAKATKPVILDVLVSYMSRVGTSRTTLNGEITFDYTTQDEQEVTIGLVCRIQTDAPFSKAMVNNATITSLSEITFIITAKPNVKGERMLRVLPYNVEYIYDRTQNVTIEKILSAAETSETALVLIDGNKIPHSEMLAHRLILIGDGKKYIIPRVEQKLRTTDQWTGLPRHYLDNDRVVGRHDGSTIAGVVGASYMMKRLTNPMVGCIEPETIEHYIQRGPDEARAMRNVAASLCTYIRSKLGGKFKPEAIMSSISDVLDEGLVVGRLDKLRATNDTATRLNSILRMRQGVMGMSHTAYIARIAISLLTTKYTEFSGHRGELKIYSPLKPRDFEMQQLPISFMSNGYVAVCPATHMLVRSYFKGAIRDRNLACTEWSIKDPDSKILEAELAPVAFVPTCIQEVALSGTGIGSADNKENALVLRMYGKAYCLDKLIHDCSKKLSEIQATAAGMSHTYVVYHHMFVLLFAFTTGNRELKVYFTDSGRASRMSKPQKNLDNETLIRASHPTRVHDRNLQRALLGYGSRTALSSYVQQANS